MRDYDRDLAKLAVILGKDPMSWVPKIGMMVNCPPFLCDEKCPLWDSISIDMCPLHKDVRKYYADATSIRTYQDAISKYPEEFL
jgi:hypothetical protein